MNLGGGSVGGLVLLVCGVGVGIGLRLLIGHLAGNPPRAGTLWLVELVLAGILGAAVGVPLVHDPAEFAAIGDGLGFGLTAYAATSGVLAVRLVGSRQPVALLSGLAHFFATSAAATAGLLLMVSSVKGF